MLRTPAPFIGALDISGERLWEVYGWNRETLRGRRPVPTFRACSMHRKAHRPCVVLQSERSGLRLPASARSRSSKLKLRRVRLQVHRSLIFPLRFVRASSIGRPERCSSHDGCAIQLLSSVLVSERAGPRHMKSIVRGPPLSNQPLERTLASCALSLPLQGTACKRRSRAC